MASRAPRRLHGRSFVAALSVVIGAGLVVASGVGTLLWLGLGRPVVAAHPLLAPADLLEIVRLALFVTGGLGGVVALVQPRRSLSGVDPAMINTTARKLLPQPAVEAATSAQLC